MALQAPRAVIVAVLITIALWMVYLSRDKLPHPRSEPKPEPPVELPRYEIWGIRDLSEEIQVSSIHVKPVFEDSSLPTKKETNATILFTDINLTQELSTLSIQEITIVAPIHKIPDASSLLVGLATQLDRLRDALPAFAHWASNTGVKFIALVEPPKSEGPTSDEIQHLYAQHGIAITLIESTSEWYPRYVSLLAVLHDHADASTKWTCIIDDDTYFFSMKRLLAMLGKYDASEPYYIGGLSENKETWDRLGYLAYGGAGVFFSMPLLKQLRPHNKDCIALPDDAGDLRIGNCITTYSLTKFTWEHYLFQMDIHGDVTGFYEAARTRPISTHHWKTWHFHDMVKVGAVGKVCGNECVLQKYMTRDGWMLTNGFSIVKYSYNKEEEMKYIEGAMEHTWADTAWVIPTSWNYTLAPLRPKDEGKIQFVIEHVTEDENTVIVYYVRRKNGLGQGIIRMIWEKAL